MDAAVFGGLNGKIIAITNRGLRQATAGSYSGGTGFTPTVTGWHRIRLQGGGGGGTSAGTRRGGCAGMYVECVMYLTAGTSYAFVVGAGGAINTTGGNTSFTGPHYTATAYGGSNDTGINGRFDGVTTDGANANQRDASTIDGARGGVIGTNGGYCGMFRGGNDGTGVSGGGGASRYAAGGNGGGTGVAGALGSGGGSGTTGAVGGAGLIEIEYIGAN